MFKASFFNRGEHSPTDCASPYPPPEFGLAATEQAAEAQVAAAGAASYQVLCRSTLWRSEQGGVDVGDVLHLVHPLEVGAYVETQLSADKPAR